MFMKVYSKELEELLADEGVRAAIRELASDERYNPGLREALLDAIKIEE